MANFGTSYTEALEAQARLADPEGYMKGKEQGQEIIDSRRGLLGQVTLDDPEALSRYITIKRAMVSEKTLYAERQRSVVYGIMSVLESHLSAQLNREGEEAA